MSRPTRYTALTECLRFIQNRLCYVSCTGKGKNKVYNLDGWEVPARLVAGLIADHTGINATNSLWLQALDYSIFARELLEKKEQEKAEKSEETRRNFISLVCRDRGLNPDDATAREQIEHEFSELLYSDEIAA